LNRSLALFSVITLTLTLTLFGFFLLFYFNVTGLLSSIQRDVEFSIYLNETIAEEEIALIHKTLTADLRVSSFRYLSKEDALALFKKEFQSETLVKHLGTNPLPASFEVNVRPAYQNPQEIGRLSQEMSKFSGVDEVQYGAEWLQNFSDFITLLNFSGLAIGTLLGIAVVTIIAHAVRLHFYDRHEEVEIMKLIGATPRFIKNPFLLEGMLLGAISGGLSCTAIFSLFNFFDSHLTEVGGVVGKLVTLQFLPPQAITGMVLAGAFLGGMGGEISLTYSMRFRAKTHAKKGALFVFALISILIGLIGFSEAKEDLSVINKHIDSEKKELKRLEREINEKRKEKNALNKKEASVLSTLETIDYRVKTLQTDASSIENKIKKKESEIGYLSTALGVLDESIAERSDLIAKRVRTLYQEGSNGLLKVLVPSSNYSAFLKRLHYIKTIAEKETEILSLFEEEQLQLTTKTNQLDNMKQQLVEEREPLVVKLSEIGKEKNRKYQLLSRVRNEKSYYEKAITELDESSRQLKSLIAKLETDRRKFKEPDLPLTNFSKVKGRLAWPNDGSVVSLFGRQKHPKFDTYVFRKGIEIETSKGENVRAIHEGSIIYADWFKGYGMMVIVNHGENFYSVYGYLTKLFVSVGDKMTKNHPIGTVGDTGISEGNRLYFEIRHEGDPMDPLTWLQKRG
jgi:septal ring factor EnvC (AmiA/AmiB activator)/cell division protein FtsX